MVAAEQRRRATPARPALRGRALFALLGLGLLALLALAALLVGEHFAEPTAAHDATAISTSISGDSDHSLPIVHALRQQPSRTRAVAFVVLATALLVVAASSRRVVRSAPGALRTVRPVGRPPGRAPPRLHIA